MTLEYKLIRSKRKTTALYVLMDGSLLVRAPLRLNKKVIDQFVLARQDWIEKHRSEITSTRTASGFLEARKTDTIFFLGEEYPIKLSEQAKKPLAFDGKQFILASNAYDQSSKLFEAWYRTQARKILNERVGWFASRHLFHPKKVRITSARTRWGSCSSIGTLSFTWRLVMAPPQVIDYVVVHELVHLVENHHQVPFWNKVAEILPDYRIHRGWLRKNGKWIIETTRNF